MSRRAILLGGSAALALAAAVVAVPLLLAPSQEEKKALYWALREGDVAKMKGLLEKNPRLANAPYDGVTPLASACGIYSPVPNRNAIVKLLLDTGADPNWQAPRCLSGAIYSSDTECIRLLLEHGADPEIRGANGKNALDIARHYDVKPIPQMIEEHIRRKSAGR